MAIIGVLVIGLIIGLLARFITPGPNPRGIIVTMVIGIVGAVIATYGGQALGLYQYGEPAGFVGSVIGAVVCWCCCGFSAGRASLLFLVLLSPLGERNMKRDEKTNKSRSYSTRYRKYRPTGTPGGSGRRCQRATSSGWLAST